MTSLELVSERKTASCSSSRGHGSTWEHKNCSQGRMGNGGDNITVLNIGWHTVPVRNVLHLCPGSCRSLVLLGIAHAVGAREGDSHLSGLISTAL